MKVRIAASVPQPELRASHDCIEGLSDDRREREHLSLDNANFAAWFFAILLLAARDEQKNQSQ